MMNNIKNAEDDGNPKLYNIHEYNLRIHSTYGELYNKTLERRQKIISLGFNYEEIWENDWKKTIRLITKIQKMFRSSRKQASTL
jgi:hypothetical protein